MRYNVELDGISLLESSNELLKGDIVRLNDSMEVNHYTVAQVDNHSVKLKMLKYTENVIKETKFEYFLLHDRRFCFENKLSKNQIVMLNGVLYRITDIEKETKRIVADMITTVHAHVMYGVYGLSEGLSRRDRECQGYLAERYFKRYGDAYGYVLKQRGLGNQVSM